MIPEDQLLAEVVKAERPDLEELKVRYFLPTLSDHMCFGNAWKKFDFLGWVDKAAKWFQNHAKTIRRWPFVQIIIRWR